MVGDIGAVATIDTRRGRFLLMLVSPQVTGVELPWWGGFSQATLVDSPHPGARYLVALGDNRFGETVAPVLVRDGPHTVARINLGTGAGETPREWLDIQATGVHGRWSGYRRAGSAGLIYGGNQEVGFYQRDAATCVLYRRLGVDVEQLLADVCLAPVPGSDALWHSSVTAAPAGYDFYEVLAVVRGVPVAEVRCSFCDATPFIVHPDPNDPATVALTFAFVPAEEVRGDMVVDLVAPDGSVQSLRIPGMGGY